MKYLSVSIGLVAATLMAGACNGSETASSGSSGISGGSSGTTGSGTTGSGTTGSGVSTGKKKSNSEVPPMEAGCNADAAQWAVGQVLSDDLMERARQDAGATVVRPLLPGLAVTQEYRFDRLNLEVDETRVVIAVRCG